MNGKIRSEEVTVEQVGPPRRNSLEKWAKTASIAGMARQSLRSLFCQRYDRPDSDYERRAFSLCLYTHAKMVAPIIHRIAPEFFAPDLKFIRDLGETIGSREASAEASNYQDANRARPNFWRTGLKIRVSGRKATALAYRLFAEERKHETSTRPISER